jgi:hypothetical protein
VAVEIGRLMRGLSKKDLDCASRFFYRWQQCQRYVVVDRCGDCGRDQPGTGSTFYSGAIFCAGRTCDVCSKRRADARAKFFDRVFPKVNVVPEYQWALITITFPRSPGQRRPADLPAVKAKVRSLIEFSRKLWRNRLKAPGAGLFRMIETSYRGMLHVHGVYFGPPVTSTELASWCKDIDQTSGFVDVEVLTTSGVEQTKAAVVRAARYSEKGGHKPPRRPRTPVGTRVQLQLGAVEESEEYLADETVRPMPIDPMVAARFELASRYVHLAEPYGAFRGLGAVEDDDDGVVEGGASDSPVPASGDAVSLDAGGGEPASPSSRCCVHCGSTAPLVRGLRRTDSYLRECHRLGSHGLVRSGARVGRDPPMLTAPGAT